MFFMFGLFFTSLPREKITMTHKCPRLLRCTIPSKGARREAEVRRGEERRGRTGGGQSMGESNPPTGREPTGRNNITAALPPSKE